VLGDDKNLYLTVINKEHGTGARMAEVSLESDLPHRQVISLTGPGNDISATSGETLGGAEIKSDGSWSGNWSPSTEATLKIPAASAAIIKLSAK